MLAKSRPSATSLMVKSNSLRATKSSSSQAASEPAASTATLAPIMPILRLGLAAFSARTVFTSEANDGVEVCSTTRSRSFTSGSDVGEAEPVRRRVDQLGALDQRGGLRQPGRIPERLDLAPVLIARAGSAIEALERRRLQKQGLHHGGRDLRSDFRMPSDISS